MNAKIHKQLQLWWQFTRRDIEVRHKGSYLGILWLLLSPLLEFAIYTIVFGLIFGGRYGVVESETHATYALGIFLSLTLYRFAAETIAVTSTVIVGQPNLVKKVVFPVHILPLSALGGICFRVSISLLLFVIGFLFFGPGFHLTNLWFPLVLLPLILLSIGTSWLLSALGVFLRDINQITGAATLVLLYSSAVFYSANMIQAKSPLAWAILKFNPLLHTIEDARRVLLWQIPPAPISFTYSLGVGLVVSILGWLCFNKLRPAFADVL
ncbi:ABC-type polysaccharide/polyol phosphate export system, permease component [Opitutaceae bacterium TAV1]|nr:ABC-type polysaccharide/polyol phosphate export system, permease component [Opitutaceae bacterium TAV1]